MRFEFRRLSIPDLIEVTGEAFGDARGFYAETWRENVFIEGGVGARWVQEAQSRSSKGVVRGLHFQKEPRAQAKLVRVARGRLYDVAVDVRKGSPTYGKWEAVELSDENHKMLYIPPGFAHGFCALSESVDMVYKLSDYWAPETEGGVRWDDPALAIPWPTTEPGLSKKDAAYPVLSDADCGFVYKR